MSNHGALLESEVFEEDDRMARKVGFEGLYYITHIDKNKRKNGMKKRSPNLKSKNSDTMLY
jgi:hypothetical protein